MTDFENQQQLQYRENDFLKNATQLTKASLELLGLKRKLAGYEQ
jgi:hypothetical protein